MMMTGLERSELSQVAQDFDPLALCPIDDGHLEAFGCFWIDDADKQAEGDEGDHSNLASAGDEIMPEWMCQAQFPQENHDAEKTAALELPLYNPPSVSSTVYSTSGDVAGFSEHELRSLSVKDLNIMLKTKGLTRQEVQMVKQRRRTIKNRGYAQECRKKRMKVTESLETRNSNLGMEMARARDEIANLKRERDMYKTSWMELVVKIEKAGLNDLFFGAMIGS